jgi:hypothetical protein
MINWSYCFWAYDEVAHCSERIGKSKTAHSQRGNKKKEENGEFHNPLWVPTQWKLFNYHRPRLLEVPTSPIAPPGHQAHNTQVFEWGGGVDPKYRPRFSIMQRTIHECKGYFLRMHNCGVAICPEEWELLVPPLKSWGAMTDNFWFDFMLIRITDYKIHTYKVCKSGVLVYSQHCPIITTF